MSQSIANNMLSKPINLELAANTQRHYKPIRFDMIHLSEAYSVRILKQVIYIHLTFSPLLTPIR